jgi:hypothetical protein
MWGATLQEVREIEGGLLGNKLAAADRCKVCVWCGMKKKNRKKIGG